MKSINNKLVKSISVYISLLLIILLLITDISVDSWIETQFNKAITNKANLLITLISESPEKVHFAFVEKLMPEFSGKQDAEYFEIWRNKQTFIKSDTLTFFQESSLPQSEIPLNSHKIIELTLPDGRAGKMFISKFLPQIDENYTAQVLAGKKSATVLQQQPMTLAYALSIEKLERLLWFVDIIFLSTSIFTVFIVRLMVKRIVSKGLAPLVELNKQLKKIDITADKQVIKMQQTPEELMPVIAELNQFIQENNQLYSREKRLTSDIAHELKTPITELINLAEVAIKFPDDTHFAKLFQPEVLNISLRMKHIVNSILLLQKSRNVKNMVAEALNSDFILKLVNERYSAHQKRLKITVPQTAIDFITNTFALETILTNLLENAFFYSPQDSLVELAISHIPKAQHEKKTCQISIKNFLNDQITENDLTHFCEPLWQKDNARTSAEHFGLGLSIVQTYCQTIAAQLNIKLTEDQAIIFTIQIHKDT